ncbi:MAG: S9 family peptidase [Candidatus Eremiobacterota bacterium]
MIVPALTPSVSREVARPARATGGGQPVDTFEPGTVLKPDLKTYLTLPAQGAPRWAPDSRRFAYLSNHTGTSQVYLREPDGATRPLTRGDQGVSFVSWSPDGKWLLYAQDTDGDERAQLHLVSPDGREHRNVTGRPGVIHSYGGFSPDSRQILYSSNARDPRHFDLYTYDLESGSTRLLLQREGMNDPQGFSPDGARVLFETGHSNLNSDLFVLDTLSGDVRHLTPHQGDVRYAGARFTPDGRSLLLTTDRGGEFMTLSRLDLETGAITPLVRHDWDVESFTVSEDGRTVAYTLNQDGYSRLHILDLESGLSRPGPELPEGVIGGLDLRQDGKLSLKVNEPAGPSRSLLFDLETGDGQVILQGSLGPIHPGGLVKPELVRFPSHDGLDIPAFLYRPPDAPADRPLPAVVVLHGGPESQTRPTFSPLHQYLVDQGFAILAPNIRGSTGYGKSYTHLDDVERRPEAIGDVAMSAEYLKKIGVDPARIAVMGGSYGGYMALAALAFDRDNWAAGVDVVGISDLETFMKNTGAWRVKNRAAEYGDPEKDREVLRMWSPIHYVDQMEAPLMVVQGANDPRVPRSEADQIVASFRERGKQVEYLLYPDEGHGVARLENRVHCYENVARFLREHLQGDFSVTATSNIG